MELLALLGVGVGGMGLLGVLSRWENRPRLVAMQQVEGQRVEVFATLDRIELRVDDEVVAMRRLVGDTPVMLQAQVDGRQIDVVGHRRQADLEVGLVGSSTGLAQAVAGVLVAAMERPELADAATRTLREGIDAIDQRRQLEGLLEARR